MPLAGLRQKIMRKKPQTQLGERIYFKHQKNHRNLDISTKQVNRSLDRGIDQESS